MIYLYWTVLALIISLAYYTHLQHQRNSEAVVYQEKLNLSLAEEAASWRKHVIRITAIYAESGHHFLSSIVAKEYVEGEDWCHMSDMDKYVLTLLILEAENANTK